MRNITPLVHMDFYQPIAYPVLPMPSKASMQRPWHGNDQLQIAAVKTFEVLSDPDDTGWLFARIEAWTCDDLRRASGVRSRYALLPLVAGFLKSSKCIPARMAIFGHEFLPRYPINATDQYAAPAVCAIP
jgi:hypothetical protein